jgi:hypothetical protein
MIVSRPDPKRRYWRIIRYYHGQDDVVAEIQTTHITNQGLIGLMRMILAKSALTEDEIIVTHLRGNVKRHFEHMPVNWHRSSDAISCHVHSGSSWVSASVVIPDAT